MSVYPLFVRIMVLRVDISIASRRDKSRGQALRIDPRDNEKTSPANTRNILLSFIATAVLSGVVFMLLKTSQTQIWAGLAQKWSLRADTEPCAQQDPQYCGMC